MGSVFETARLRIRRAEVSTDDVEMYFRLWNHPRVMANVGFPDGLGITREEIIEKFNGQPDTEYETRLIVERKSDAEKLGECKLGEIDENGVSATDVKLFPENWGQGYGKEIKRGLVDYLFANRPDCLAVKADPKATNIPSQKMQEAVGGVRIAFDRDYPVSNIETYRPPKGHYLYLVFRDS